MKILMTMSILLLCGGSLSAEVIKAEGKGFLEMVNGQKVLHVKGTPYEMGFQHGSLLKDDIQKNIAQHVTKPRPEQSERAAAFAQNLPKLLSYIPQAYLDEMKGLAEGAGIPYQKVLQLNLFPEMFHCAGITINGPAAKDGQFYHMRVLDYGVGKGLQNSAVLIAAEPHDTNNFINVSYAGFIGSITGMNGAKIALGEIGGAGYGNWDGIPMSFLMRMVLEQATTLDEAKQIFASSPRTCEYYYIISDGNSKTSCGVYATSSQIHFVDPGMPYAFMAPKNPPKNYGNDGLNDKYFITDYKGTCSAFQTVVTNSEGQAIALFNRQPENCIVLTGFTHPERYPVLADRIMAAYGKIDETTLQQIIMPPVTKETNLHNAIFMPAELKFWVAHAGPNDEPAMTQPYAAFSFENLFILN